MSEVFVVRDDRDLRFSAEWDGESLVFDSPTSDLFVLSTASRLLLETLLEAGAMDVPALTQAIWADVGHRDPELETTVDELLVELVACRLVEPLCVDCCGSDSS